MIRAPLLLLFAALLAVGVGAGMLAVAGQEPELWWYGVGVTALGLLLAALWFRDRLKPLPASPEKTAAAPPGRWYPVALLVILAAQAVWFVWWTKPR